ncbi:MAG: SDR family NAD(P)-dependent oxidoreductase [Spirochaetota bacterium]
MIAIDLSGRVAVVTGASGELGRVIARTLAAAGARVAVHYNSSKEKALAVQAEIENSGGTAMIVQADITDEQSVNAMRDAVSTQLGDARIIVNNAVIQYEWEDHPLDQPLSDFESQFRSCVLQNVLMARAFVPGMKRKGGGRIIAMNTECSMQYEPSQSAYVSGKRGMDGFLRSLAKDIGGHGITVNQVAPGWTVSEKYRESGQESQPEYEAGVPLRRRGSDQEIANAVAFLASDLASFITGVYLPVCGGNVMPSI